MTSTHPPWKSDTSVRVSATVYVRLIPAVFVLYTVLRIYIMTLIMIVVCFVHLLDARQAVTGLSVLEGRMFMHGSERRTKINVE